MYPEPPFPSHPNTYVYYPRSFDMTRHIKPGGWVEQVELSSVMRSEDGSIPDGSAIQRWTGIFDDIGDKLGITFRAAESAYPAITEAGFINITERIIKVPLGPWPKDKRLKSWGQWCRYFSLEGMEGFALRSLVDVLGARCSNLPPTPRWNSMPEW